MDKKICIDISNNFKSDKGIETIMPSDEIIDSINLFSELWKKFGLSEYDISPDQRRFTLKDKIDCLEMWAENIFPPDIINIDFLQRKILNNESSIIFEKKNSYFSATSLVLFDLDDRTVEVDSLDLVPFEIDILIGDLNKMDDNVYSEIKFNDYVQIAEKNLSYHNDLADETALKYFKMALEVKPDDIEIKKTFTTLDKIVNHKNHVYVSSDESKLDFCKIFVECCNVKGFERLYDLISDDFVCTSKYFGRTKKAFIDSIYFERKSWQGLTTKIGIYTKDDKKTPCVMLNDFGVLLFDLENDKLVRAFEHKIGETIDKSKLTEWND